MKTITKLSALGILALGLVGCNEDNDKAAMKDPTTGKASAPGVAPPGTPRSSADFNKKTSASNPMMNNPNYKNAGK